MPARAAALVNDQYTLGEARSMEERLAEIDQVDLDQLNAYLSRRTPSDRTIVAVGPEPPGEGFEAEEPLCRAVSV